MAERVRKKRASLQKLVDPEFVTVVKSPANQTGFKVIRNDGDAESIVEKTKTRVRKKVRSDSMLLSISLPEGVDQETAAELLNVFSLEADYEVVQNGELYSLKRKGSDDSVKTLPIDLGEGIVANVAASTFQRSDTAKREDRPGVRLVRIDFNEEHFPSIDSVKDWLDRFEIDFKEGGVERIGDGFSVTRHDTDVEAKRISIGDGITGVIVRSSETDVPTRIYRSVVDTAYGNWGWGHIDFAAALADPEFSDKSWDAIWALHDVLENIVLYSGLPLSERKDLITYACSQYAAFMVNLIDALPTEVIDQVKNSDGNLLTKQETSPMSKKTDKTKVEDQDNTETESEAQAITREDVSSMIGDALTEKLPDAVAAGVAAAFEKITKRDDDDKDEGENAANEKSDDKAVLAAIEKLATRMDGVDESIKTLRADKDEDEEETNVSRSDDDDTGEEDEGGSTRKRSDSPFGGMFQHLGVGRQQ